MTTSIYDLDQYPLSDRNGSYGGNSGDKEGILINDDYWIVKYPDSTKGLSNIGSLQFTSSPLSEYIGSHIYAILGYDVHDTVLGIRNDTLVVACKDFCDDTHRLSEFRQLKNTYGRELSKQLETTFKTTGSDHFTDLNAIIAHLKTNPIMVTMPELTTRFWDCAIIDGFINNNDRNNGNWGILSSKTDRRIAPVFDNGSAFSPKIAESKIKNKLENEQALSSGVLNTTTSYSIDGERALYFRDLLKLDMYKKIIAIVLAAVSLTACGSNTKTTDTTKLPVSNETTKSQKIKETDATSNEKIIETVKANTDDNIVMQRCGLCVCSLDCRSGNAKGY